LRRAGEGKSHNLRGVYVYVFEKGAGGWKLASFTADPKAGQKRAPHAGAPFHHHPPFALGLSKGPSSS